MGASKPTQQVSQRIRFPNHLAQNSLGSSHCASAFGKYRDSSGNVRDVFYRGCIDCAGKVTELLDKSWIEMRH